MRSCERKKGPVCGVPCAMVKAAGVALVAVGAVMALVFIPVRMWLALLGVALLAAGVLMVRLT